MTRPVDRAMKRGSTEKQLMRSIWVDEVKEYSDEYPDCGVPLYLTLPGGEGLDIQALIDAELVSLNETMGIVEEDQGKIVAVESSNNAVLQLQRKYVGLRIKEVNFQSLIRGNSPMRWPDGEDEVYCRAKVVNLDLNSSLTGTKEKTGIMFPVIEWINKLSVLHLYPQPSNWTLCLTLHAQINWPKEISHFISSFIQENFSRESTFKEECSVFLGAEICESLSHGEILDFSKLTRIDVQKFLMIVVPKIITRSVHNNGWRVITHRNLYYGKDEVAPMVSWVFRFIFDEKGRAQPDELYKAALKDILRQAGTLNSDGSINSPINN